MKKVKVEEALGLILAHDITEIIPGKKKDAAFRRGQVIESGDIERLLDLGKRHLYVFSGETKGIHEDEAGVRIARAVSGENIEVIPAKEGKANLRSTVDGLFYVDDKQLYRVNRVEDVLLSSIANRYPVKAGDVVAAARIIPLYIEEQQLRKVEEIGKKTVFSIRPFKNMNLGMVITGSEVYEGRIKDGSDAVKERMEAYGLNVVDRRIVTDDITMIRDAIVDQFAAGADIVLTTAGLSVDPDDVTREGIEATGARVLFYGTPVFPGAMFLLAVLKGRYILGAPACVYYNSRTVLDILVLRILAGERIQKKDIVKLSYGGHCMYCPQCHYPACPLGKAP